MDRAGIGVIARHNNARLSATSVTMKLERSSALALQLAAEREPVFHSRAAQVEFPHGKLNPVAGVRPKRHSDVGSQVAPTKLTKVRQKRATVHVQSVQSVSLRVSLQQNLSSSLAAIEMHSSKLHETMALAAQMCAVPIMATSSRTASCFPFVIPWSVCVWLTTEQRQPSIISVRVLGRPLFAAEHVIRGS